MVSSIKETQNRKNDPIQNLTKEKTLAVLNFSILVGRNCEDSVLNAENIIPVIIET